MPAPVARYLRMALPNRNTFTGYVSGSLERFAPTRQVSAGCHSRSTTSSFRRPPDSCASAVHKLLPPGHGLDQGKGYLAASRHNVLFVFSSNGYQFVEFDRTSGMTTMPRPMSEFPSPSDASSIICFLTVPGNSATQSGKQTMMSR